MYRPKTASLWAIFFEFSIKNQFPAQSFQTPRPLSRPSIPAPSTTASAPSTPDSAPSTPDSAPLIPIPRPPPVHHLLTVNIDLSDVINIYYTVLSRMVRYMSLGFFWNHWTPIIDSIIGVQWFQKNPKPSGPPFSEKLGKPRFQLERWALGLGFFCPHWTPMMDPIYLTWPRDCFLTRAE